MNDRCPGCERPVATDASVCPCTPDDPGCVVCNALCWSSMHGYATCPWAIDWRARCLAAESRIDEIERDMARLSGERDQYVATHEKCWQTGTALLARAENAERIAREAIDALHQRSYGRSALGARLQAELEKLR